MAEHSKRYREARKKVEDGKRYAVAEAVALLKALPPAKFDETVEVAMRLGVDPKQADQLVRGSASLPKGLGKEVRVIAFCVGDAGARPPRPPARSTRAARNSSRRCREAGRISTSPSPRRT